MITCLEHSDYRTSACCPGCNRQGHQGLSGPCARLTRSEPPGPLWQIVASISASDPPRRFVQPLPSTFSRYYFPFLCLSLSLSFYLNLSRFSRWLSLYAPALPINTRSLGSSMFPSRESADKRQERTLRRSSRCCIL